MTTASTIAAGIIVFEPEPELVRKLVACVSQSCGKVFIFINALSDGALASELRASRQVVLIEPQRNVGVGAALNGLLERAAAEGYSDVIVFDQDSSPGPNLVAALHEALRSIAAQGLRPAAVGPVLASPSGARFKAPRYFEQTGVESTAVGRPVLYLPTSGTLISVEAFQAIGPFRADYFIDSIDLEWCFRAWSKGFSCWLAKAEMMEHRVGQGAVGLKALGFETPHQKDFRIETYVRNTIFGFRLSHIPFTWKVRQGGYLMAQAIYMTVASGFSFSLLKRLWQGVADGLRGRLGPPKGVPFTGDI